ncbi:MAG: hypothetical protein IKZ00_10895 [Bacteroidaceae bacterium]|nr:hypothetical protein [Bacteroidaceae bacterium]
MNKRPINKMLAIVVERKPEVQASHQYKYIMLVLSKDNEDISYAEKLMVRDNLRVLCAVAGLSYDRLLMRVCQD